MSTLTAIKVAAYYALGALPGVPRLMRPYRGRGAALLFHQVFPRAARATMCHPMAINVVSTERFEEQIASLRHHCTPVALDAFREQVKARDADAPLKTLPVVVTFDDGHRDVMEHALPVLERHNVPATIFVTSGYLDGSASPWWREIWDLMDGCTTFTLTEPGPAQVWPLRSPLERRRCYNDLCARMAGLPMTQQAVLLDTLRAGRPPLDYRHRFLRPEEVQALDRHPLITIGAHTHRHPALRSESEAIARGEMQQAKDALEHLLGHPVRHLAYPFGTPTTTGSREFQLAAACGFATAFTTRPEAFYGQDWHAIPRHALREAHSAARLQVKLSGWNSFWRQDV